MRNILSYTKSRSAFFADTDGEDFNYILPSQAKNLLCGEDRKLFVTELFRYASEVNRINNLTLNVMCIKPNVHLAKTNTNFYKFLKKHGIKEVTFATVVDKNSHISLLGTLNPKHSNVARELLEDIAVCFSIAVYNKKHLHRTEIAAVTDSLTGVCNRVAYKKDLPTFDKEMTEDFACLYIDVNELHLHNNKFGHTAGDEMLIYIANSLQEVFSNHHIYRMGGDEFLVFVRDMDLETVKVYVEYFTKRLESRSYHVAIGISYRSQGFGTAEEMVKEAEIRMYEAKAQYYQNKERVSVSATEGSDYVQIKTGIKEIDTMISVMKEHYWGIYRVSLITNNASSILMPSYLGYNQESNNFSGLLTSYISECVDNDFRRAVLNFLNYDVLKMQLAKGLTPRITYKKLNGETVILSIYNMKDTADNVDETLWVFAKD
ncbi:MAG: GGDEF domain-containing protein [Clostridia bacterium]|nr:GGDEF domain-containing protein [Clostridia bacterium]